MNTALTRRRSDDGFSLIELLVVMIILGLLASIAIPLYADQRRKGHDSATRSDVNAVANAVVGYLVNNSELPTMILTGTTVTVNGQDFAKLSPGVVLGSLVGTNSTDWCISATNPEGDRSNVKGYKFTASVSNVEEGQCVP
jgi:prepilin-type N-terminal cleavage/methylation domain-containing protein